MSQLERSIVVEVVPSNTESQDPESFTVWGHTLKVTVVIDRWSGKDHSYYKVRTSDGALYILRKDNASDDWSLTMYSKS